MAVTYQDVVRANGGVASWAFPEAGGATLAPWLGGQSLGVTGTLDYQQAGPFASSFSIGFHAGSKVGFSYSGLFTAPITWEQWVYFAALPSSGNQIVVFNGNTGTGGAGILIYPGGIPEWYVVGPGPTSSGGTISAGAWHLITYSIEADTTINVYVDGAFVWRGKPSTSVSSPLQLNYGGDSSNTVVWPFRLAYPTIYLRALSATEVYAQFLAKTDPASALAYTATGGGQLGVSNDAILASILAAVTVKGY